MRDEQTHPHRPRLVVSHSTCPPLSSSPHAHRFVLGTAVINTHNKETEVHFTATGMPSQHRLILFQVRGILPVDEEQSRSHGGQNVGITDQPQCRGMCHSSLPSARSLSRSPCSPPPSFTQSPSPQRSLVRDGQTSPHRPRLVVSRSTYSPLSPSLHTNNFIIGLVVINTHTYTDWEVNRSGV